MLCHIAASLNRRLALNEASRLDEPTRKQSASVN